MMELLLNAPWWLVALAGIIGVVLLFSGLQRGDVRFRKAGLIVMALGIVLLCLRYTIPTPEKKVERDTRRLVKAVEDADWAIAGQILQYTSLGDWRGQQIVERTRSASQQIELNSITITSLEAQRVDTVITVTLGVTSHHKRTEFDSAPSTWKLLWQQRQGQWILTNIEPIKIGFGEAQLQWDVITRFLN